LHRPSRTTGDKVLYFVDTYANYYDTRLGEALVRVLGHNGVTAHVPLDQRHSAMAMISQGALEPARRIAQHNVRLLAEAVRRGYTVVATEPSAVLALTHEYPIILDQDEDAVLVSENTQEACHYLWQRHQTGRLKLDFQPLKTSLGYHMPCHQRALGVGTPAENLLHLVPNLRVNRLEKGCSGMAGTYGLKHKNYRSSLRAGAELISTMRDGSFRIGATECCTCKMQMEQATTKPTTHPIKLLALAYGLMPELRDELAARGRSLVVT
jgi:Fe-S oxidoreductase